MIEHNNYFSRARQSLVDRICTCLNPEYARLKSDFYDYDFLKTALDCHPYPLILVDKDAKIIMINQAQIDQNTRTPNMGSVMYRDYASNHRTNMYQYLLECIKTGKSKEFPDCIYGKKDEKHLKIKIVPLRPVPKGAIITCEDITKTLVYERMIQRLRTFEPMIARQGLDDGI